MPKRFVNYRLNQFFLMNQSIQIAGMSGPHNHKHLATNASSKTIEQQFESLNASEKFKIVKSGSLEALKQLKIEKRDVYINLHESEQFELEAKQAGIEYHHILVDDFSKAAIASHIFGRIFEVVKQATLRGKQVTISCGAGNGRTGTALASLKVRELVEREFMENPLASEYTACSIDYDYDPPFKKPVKCTPLVRQAIQSIRDNRITLSKEEEDNGRFSVETDNDIHSLVAYEQTLRTKMKKELEMGHQMFAKHLFGSYLLTGSNPVKAEYKNATSNNISLLKEAGISQIYGVEKTHNVELDDAWLYFGNDYHYTMEDNALSMQELDTLTDSILESIVNKEKTYLYCEKGKGLTATILAALYMKETGEKAEEAIDFVRKNYMDSAIQNDVLNEFEKLLNPASLDEGIKLHKANLITASNTHHPAVQACVKKLLNVLKQNNISKKLINEVLVQSIALLKTEPNGLKGSNKYRKLVDNISKHHSPDFKKLAFVMNELATAVSNNLIVKPSILIQKHGMYPSHNKDKSPKNMQRDYSKFSA